MAKQEMSRQYFTVDEAETTTGISKWTWRRWAYAQRIEVVKTSASRNGKLLIPASEIQRVLNEGRKPRINAVAVTE